MVGREALYPPDDEDPLYKLALEVKNAANPG
jgi:hypothetical protein